MQSLEAEQRAGSPEERMFEHILVPTDLTDRSATAIETAVQIARHPSTRLTLLHVIETIAGGEQDEFDSFYRMLEQKAASKMEPMASRAASAGLQVSTHVVYGRCAEEIVRHAEESDVDLIILASHKVRPSGMMRDWCTISYKVRILSQCAVLLVK